MSDSERWVEGIFIADQFKHPKPPRFVEDGRVLVERLTRSVMLYSGPTEVFSPMMPAHPTSRAEEGTLPIDVLYGRYIPKQLKIELFVRRNQADAHLFGSEFVDLLTIIRVREYAHAAVHMAVDMTEVPEQLAKLRLGGTTDWGSFRRKRNRMFSEIDDERQELLAQAITWACIWQLPPSTDSERLIETFLTLERRQQRKYQLPPKVRQRARLANWPVVLRAARRELDVRRGPSFSHIEGLTKLITSDQCETTASERPACSVCCGSSGRPWHS